jgi:D-glycero-D-manno-heptose 1,7-bisphosphate phosphatase
VGSVPYLVLTGKGEKTREKGGLPPGTQIFDNLAQVVDHLLKADAAKGRDGDGRDSRKKN